MHLCILPDNQNQVLKKDIFFTSGVVKNEFCCIPRPPESSPYKRYFSTSGRVLMHFLTTGIKSLKSYFLSSGVVKNVFWCICAYFQTTRIKFLKKIFFNVWSSKNFFWCISWPLESSPLKIIKKRVLMHFQATRI